LLLSLFLLGDDAVRQCVHERASFMASASRKHGSSEQNSGERGQSRLLD